MLFVRKKIQGHRITFIKKPKKGKKNEKREGKRERDDSPAASSHFHTMSISPSTSLSLFCLILGGWGLAVEVSLDAEGIAGEGLMECIGVNIGKVGNTPQPPSPLAGRELCQKQKPCVFSSKGPSFRVLSLQS